MVVFNLINVKSKCIRGNVLLENGRNVVKLFYMKALGKVHKSNFFTNKFSFAIMTYKLVNRPVRTYVAP